MSDQLDGCQVVLDATDAVTDEEADLLCLFPGDLDVDVDVLAAQWRLLFGNPLEGDDEMASYAWGEPVVMGYRPRRMRSALARILGRGRLDYDRLLAVGNYIELCAFHDAGAALNYTEAHLAVEWAGPGT